MLINNNHFESNVSKVLKVELKYYTKVLVLSTTHVLVLILVFLQLKVLVMY